MISKRIYIIVFATFISISNYIKANNDTVFINKDIQLFQIADSIYVHISWTDSEKYGRFTSNGLVYIKNGNALLVDTPMDSNQTEILFNYLQDSLNLKLTHFIAGHYHADCIGGLQLLHNKGVVSYGNKMTQEICKKQNLPIPQIGFTDSLKINFNSQEIICYYLGAGHTVDNIVVYFKHEKILFGGCLVKSTSSHGIGNTKDANMKAWPITIIKLKQKFTHTCYVIPGHGEIGNTEQYDHTLRLINNFLYK